MTAPPRDPTAAQIAAVVAPADEEFAGWTRLQLLAEVRRCETKETEWGMRRRRARLAANLLLPFDDGGGDG